MDIENWCKCCLACQSYSNKKGVQELSNWPKVNKPFERIQVDFFHFDKCVFLILIDVYSKWLEVVMSKTNASATIGKLREIFSVFGLPAELVADNGPPFDSNEFRMFCDKNGMKLTHSPPYHPQSNGSGEVFVTQKVRYIRC